MSGLALVLVLSSAGLHATWNLLVKRSNNFTVLAQPTVFMWLMEVSTAAVLAPLGIYLFLREPVDAEGWSFLIIRVGFNAAYLLLLSHAYAKSDLSLVYPIARGISPALAPVLGVTLLGEQISVPAVVGIAAVVLGIYTLYWWGQVRYIVRDPLRLVRESGTRFALLTGAIIAGYTVFDKEAVSHVNPFLYTYLYMSMSSLFLSAYMVKTFGASTLRASWQSSGREVLTAAILAFLSYGLVLSALRLAQVSYVAPVREVGIVMGVILGSLLLKEPFGRGRAIGASVVVLGIVFISVAP